MREHWPWPKASGPRIAALAIPHPASPIAAVVTVSLGVATLSRLPGIEANQFIARADQALYRKKRQGRKSGDDN